MKNQIILVIILLNSLYVIGNFKRFTGKSVSTFRGSIRGQENVFKLFSSDERFTASISPTDGLCIINNDNQDILLKINNVQIHDFGFSVDNNYFFVDYCNTQHKKIASKPSIDIFDLYTGKKVFTLPYYDLRSCCKRASIFDFNDFIICICGGNNLSIRQKFGQKKKIGEFNGVSLIKYCTGNDCFACFFKSGVLKLFQMDYYGTRELFAFIPYSRQNPGRNFYKPLK